MIELHDILLLCILIVVTRIMLQDSSELWRVRKWVRDVMKSLMER